LREQHMEHRLPLPKLAVFYLYRWSGDIRSGMYCNVAALALLAGVMIRVAQRFRGTIAYADAFFPLALLHYGYCDTFLRGWQVAFVIPTLLACVVLTIIVRRGLRLPFGVALAAGFCLIALGLSGPAGLAYVPALAIWLGLVGGRYWVSGHPA